MPEKGITTDDAAPAVVAPAFAVGQVIAGRYRLESRLGAGGGGTVWRAFDEKLEAIVAFKIVASDVDLERWRREVAMARRIAHRNVCRVHDLGETPELRFVTMELVEGKTLRSKIAPELPAGEARALFRQVVAGVAAIHEAGIIHRDLKPENVVVEPSGRAVIVDFGLAREPQSDSIQASDTLNMRGPTQTSAPASSKPPSETVTSAGVVVGTPRYMSPEQSVGDTVDERTDIWALGLIGHELLVGILPALDEDGGRRVGAIAKWPECEPVLRRCLALLPKDRFEDARALSVALAEPTQKPRGKRRIAIAVVAAVAATGAVVGVRRLVRDDKQTKHPKDDRSPPKPTPIDGVKSLRITDTADKWPRDAPMSVALSPDATRFAYTTPARELFVRALAGGEPKQWSMPALELPSKTPGEPPPRPRRLLTAWVAGWFSDGSLAVLGTTYENRYYLFRTYEDGRHTLLHTSAQRFAVVITPTDQPLITKADHGIGYAAGVDHFDPQIVIGAGDRVTHLAMSPDGKRIAYVRVPGKLDADVELHVSAPNGQGDAVAWRAKSPGVLGEMLAWLDDDRIAFVNVDAAARKSRILVHDRRTTETTPRTDWTTDHLGTGSAARGVAIVLGGPTSESVQVAGARAWPLERVHETTLHGHALAGWTSDGSVVFALGDPGKERVVRASASNAIEPWPGTTAGVEVPDAVAGDAIITHKREGGAIVIEHIDRDGKHTPLQRIPDMPLDRFVRCAGERAEPCMLERIEGNQVTWTKLDPKSGELGPQLQARPLTRELDAALAPDGSALVIVDGSTVLSTIQLVPGRNNGIETIDQAEALQSITFAANHESIWLTGESFKGYPSRFARIGWSDSQRPVDVLSLIPDEDGALRTYARPTANADGTKLAVVVRELRLEVTRIDGL